MIKKNALRKILITTITLFILLVLYVIPNIYNDQLINTNTKYIYTSGVGKGSIYLLDSNNLLVKSKIILIDSKKEKNIETILKTLIIDSNKSIPDKLYGTIPKNTKINSINITDDIVLIDFSKEILNISEDKEDCLIESIVFSIMDLGNISGIKIFVNGNKLNKLPSGKVLPEILNKEIGINKRYNINNRKDIQRVVLYYLEDIDNVNYYVPVTKYVNDSNDKIKIIIDNLTTSYIYEPNLMSLVNKNLKVNSYKQEENVMLIDLNNAIFNSNQKIDEEVIYTLSYSIFDSYSVESVIYTVDNKELTSVNKN